LDENVLQIELCAPERDPVHLEASEVILPGTSGVFGVLPGHTVTLSSLLPGAMRVFDSGGNEDTFALSGGFAEVLENRVLVLAETAESRAEIDLARAQASHERAEKRLGQRAGDVDVARAERALHRALARLDAHSSLSE